MSTLSLIEFRIKWNFENTIRNMRLVRSADAEPPTLKLSQPVVNNKKWHFSMYSCVKSNSTVWNFCLLQVIRN